MRPVSRRLKERTIELWYPFGVGCRVAACAVQVRFVEPNQLNEVFDSDVSERLDAVLSDAMDQDDVVLDFHFVGNVPQPIFIFAEVLGDLGNSGDVMDHSISWWPSIIR